MKKYLLLFLILIPLLFISCNEDIGNNPVGNQAPETGLFLYPDSTISKQPSRLHVHWWGDDRDGTILGFYFKWVGIDSAWKFTTSNDSIFALPIGSSDTTYDFLVASVDAEGNGKYDSQVNQNGISFNSEPFIDANKNGIYDEGEKYYDIGLIDPTPSSLNFPIKNTPPVTEWNELTVLPDTSFPVMTFAWNADDLDGTESIQSINISLNDTTNYVSLNGSTRLITLRVKDFNVPSPEMEILINGSDQNIFPELLPGLQLNADNKFYVQAVDLSGALSETIVLPDTGKTWYVKKPKGKLLIFDDFAGSSSDNEATNFYRNIFSTMDGGTLAGKFDEYDLAKQPLPFQNVTLLETIKLFEYTYWYSVSNPSLNLLNIVTNKYIQQGGKIAFSMTFQDSSASFAFDLSTLQGFIPIDSVSKKISSGFLLPGAEILPTTTAANYKPLKTTVTISYVRTFVPNATVTTRLYKFDNQQVAGNVGFISNDKTTFFIGMPLHQCNGGDQNVDDLLKIVFIDEFGLTP